MLFCYSLTHLPTHVHRHPTFPGPYAIMHALRFYVRLFDRLPGPCYSVALVCKKHEELTHRFGVTFAGEREHLFKARPDDQEYLNTGPKVFIGVACAVRHVHF